MLKLDNCHHREHYVKNGLWFTEDHIPVRKLFLTNIPEDLKEDTLFEHFKRFGSVISAQLFYNAGFVLFANASDATKALEIKNHHVNGHIIDVIVAESWHQPDSFEASQPPTAGDQSGEAYILKIPDDCLSMILKFLPLADQVHFQTVCKRFQFVYQLTARSIHKSIASQELDNLTLLECRQFFLISGPCVTDLNLTHSNFPECMLKYFGRNCINLKSLQLPQFQLTVEIMFEIFSSTDKLENLKLNNCYLADKTLLALKNLKNLKKLDLAWNYSLSGLHLEELPVSIENLNLMGCHSIQSGYLIQMCKSLTNLRELDIGYVDSNLAEVFNNMVKKGYCPLLETLRLSIDGKYEDIAQLPKLKSIYIHYISEKINVTELFDQLVLFKSKELEELKIKLILVCFITKEILMKIPKLSGLKTLAICCTPNIDDEVLNAFTNLRKLEHIDLGFCDQVNDSNVLRLVLGCPKLQKIPIHYKKNERKLPITIYLRSSKGFHTPTAQDIVKIISII
ncbi:putative F-box/LRR-repeat protein At4g15060 isoform X2 [Drosophila willistoni]|uniref:putative F-box/LRR-repeat protein At4g15060 isoform X2 n=1 Tax=Drosophila willistoni TaxID=7260 RepID=UPI001F0850F1|nr:putative F-box/LRR-repeat protein At4g15060 isoform X2 [Drosophila willistoni]